MKTRMCYFAICGAIVVLFLYINRADIQNNITDYFVWKKITREIKSLQIDKIEFPSNINIKEATDKHLFLNQLLKSNYYRSNWKKEGLTGLIIIVHFTCGYCITFQYWGKNIFEVMSPCKRQFLIKSNTLSETLRNKGVTL
ncbi:MAG: hypothetical protein JW915_16840 [Chitinispirillaceae bacterium]|nr:hypothetical protein [Chitinispirillaceae bacterium]